MQNKRTPVTQFKKYGLQEPLETTLTKKGLMTYSTLCFAWGNPESRKRYDLNAATNCLEFLKFPHFFSPDASDKLKLLRKDAALSLENED